MNVSMTHSEPPDTVLHHEKHGTWLWSSHQAARWDHRGNQGQHGHSRLYFSEFQCPAFSLNSIHDSYLPVSVPLWGSGHWVGNPLRSSNSLWLNLVSLSGPLVQEVNALPGGGGSSTASWGWCSSWSHRMTSARLRHWEAGRSGGQGVLWVTFPSKGPLTSARPIGLRAKMVGACGKDFKSWEVLPS